MPFFFKFEVTVASYGGRQPSKILEPAVVGTPFWVKISFSATGTPARGAKFSPLVLASSIDFACANAPSLSRYKNAFT